MNFADKLNKTSRGMQEPRKEFIESIVDQLFNSEYEKVKEILENTASDGEFEKIIDWDQDTLYLYYYKEEVKDKVKRKIIEKLREKGFDVDSKLDQKIRVSWEECLSKSDMEEIISGCEPPF